MIFEFYSTEDQAIARCREINRGLTPDDQSCDVVIEGPDDDYAVLDQETAREILDDSRIPYLIVTE